MKKLRLCLLAVMALTIFTAKADEGMWLLQLMKQQNSIDLMKKKGLLLEAEELYNPNGVSLKDAVGIFGRGCTGEIISSNGLILTNHHCGYASIQQHSSVEKDYLTDGFWAKSFADELPTPGLTFTFVERIVDVTDIINNKVKSGEFTELDAFSAKKLSELAVQMLEQSDLKGKKVEPQILPFYAGNKYYLFFKKIYTDVRMVVAPPSSIGKFGGETDNWGYPRHTGDFSMFRVYADANGEPADYSPANTPLKTKKYLKLSVKGYNEGDYSMVMGFPGSTSRYLTQSEVKSRMYDENEPRIKVRSARLDVLRAEMAANDKTRIQYASKFASSSNYWKNSIGMNKAIIDNKVLDTKAELEAKFLQFAKEKGNKEYEEVVSRIDNLMAKLAPVQRKLTYFTEVFFSGMEFASDLSQLREMLEKKDMKTLEKALPALTMMREEGIFNKDYDHEVDRKVAKALIPLYAEVTPREELPDFYNVIEKKFKGDYNKFIDAMYDKSIMSSKVNLDKFIKKPTLKAIDNDLLTMYTASIGKKFSEMIGSYRAMKQELTLLHKVYQRGLEEMKLPVPSYPDANFTIRLTYGTVEPYSPKDGVKYGYYTTAEGILEKENPNDREFVVPAQLKELILKKDYGRYALPNGQLPICFITTNDITGGNSGSPVLNAKGELIGCAFDGNWESLSGDISFDNKLQRCINLDIRYVLFLLEKMGGCTYLFDEMTIVE